MTYLTDRQITSNKFGESFTTWDLIVMNPPYSTYINDEGKKIVNPSQLMVEEASQLLSKKGQIVILCRSRDIGMNAKSGNKIRNSIIFDSIHYSSNNFNFTEVNSSIVGIIGSKEGETGKVLCFIDNTLISKTENQRFLPRIYRKQLINLKAIGLLLKVFSYKNIEKFGNGDLYLWNGLMNHKQATKEGLTESYFNGLRLVSCNSAPKNWSLPGENAESSSFNKFLFSKLFIFLGDAEAQDQRFKIRSSTSSFIKGCIPDNWRELDTDEKIYTHFNLTQEEIDFVENYQVQCYSSSTGTSAQP